jgi:hypothetical protein
MKAEDRINEMVRLEHALDGLQVRRRHFQVRGRD